MALGLLGYYGASILDFLGLQYISASLERLILFTYPLLTILIGVFFFGTRLGWPEGAALLLSLPFLIAAYRKLKALSMLLAEMGVKPEMAGRHTQRVRRIIAEIIPLLSLLMIFVLLAALSASILPTLELLLLIAVVAAAVVAVLWRWFIRVHTRMQVALLETLDNNVEH